MYCIPACKGCREAGVCPKGETPASHFAVPSKPARADPRALGPGLDGAILRDQVSEVRRVVLSACGHPIPVAVQRAILAGLLATEWECRDCGTWRKINIYPDAMNHELLF